MLFLHSYTQKSIILGKFNLGHSPFLFPHLHSILLTTENKLDIENDRMLE